MSKRKREEENAQPLEWGTWLNQDESIQCLTEDEEDEEQDDELIGWTWSAPYSPPWQPYEEEYKQEEHRQHE